MDASNDQTWRRFATGEVTRVDRLTRESFILEHRFRHPVVHAGGARDSRAFARWDLDYLRERAGAAQVTVGVYGDDLRDYYRNPTLDMTLAEFLVKFTDPSFGRNFYLFNNQSCIFARNEGRPEFHVGWGRRTNPGLSALADDFEVPAFCGQDFVYAALILGSRANATRVHYDWGGEAKALVQLRGRKRLLLLPPAAARHLDLEGNGSLPRVDLARPDDERYPDLKNVQGLVTVLEPGDVIYWPSFWFHDVTNLDDVSLAVTMAVDELPVSSLFFRHCLLQLADAMERLGRRPASGDAPAGASRIDPAELRALARACEGLHLARDFDTLWAWNHVLPLLATVASEAHRPPPT